MSESTQPRHLVDKRAVARKLGVSLPTLDRLVRAGKAPPPIRFSATCVRWDSHAIDTWIASGFPQQQGVNHA